MWSNQIESGPAPSGETALPRNHLLRSLPRQDLERLAPLLHKVPLTPRRVLQHAGVPVEHLYFIETGLISVLAKTDDRNAVEVWLIGRDGLVGSAALLGVETTTLSHFVQIGGSALRIGVEDLDRAMYWHWLASVKARLAARSKPLNRPVCAAANSSKRIPSRCVSGSIRKRASMSRRPGAARSRT